MPYPNEHACRFLPPEQVNILGSQSVEHNGKDHRIITGKKKSDGTAVKQSFRYPKGSWTAAEARAHCESKDGKSFEPATNNELFHKDLLYPGTFPHPQRPDEKISMTPKDLLEIAQETNRFLDRGGSVPVTISHPADEKEKITNVRGWLLGVTIDKKTGKLYGDLDLGDEASDWIKKNQVQSVSPGIVSEVVTANGEFTILIDHVALTNSPHLLGQDEFVPMVNAEKFKVGQIFFEGGKQGCKQYTTTQKGGIMNKVLESIRQLGKTLVSFQAADGDNGGNGPAVPAAKAVEVPADEVAALKAKIAALQEQLKALVTEKETLTEKIEDVEVAAKEVEEAAEQAVEQEFDTKADKLIESARITPDEKSNLKTTFDRMRAGGNTVKVGDKEVGLAAFILDPFEDKEPKTKTKLQNTIALKKQKINFDVSTPEGRNELSDYILQRAKSEGKDYPTMKDIVLAEAGIVKTDPTE